ncbi:MAG: YkgJ family cysteine cluster protein [Acidobacteriota bacterium]
MIRELSRPYPARQGAPRIRAVDEAIFRYAYFSDCRTCSFCKDQCCSWGVDVDAANMARLFAHAEPLEARTGLRRERWFESEIRTDPEFPGGRVGRTRAENGGCVFLDRDRGGCHIHAYCLEAGLDVYGLKPLVSALFPLTFEDEALVPSREAEEGTLVCRGAGKSLYRGSRGALEYHFGGAFVAELDRLELLQAGPRG